jgi:putative two-component system response regulator
MHDIGKIGIPDAILRKPGPLTPQERQIVQTHNWIGAKILGNPQSELMEVAREVALTHHERWDGSGYPQGLSGEAIPVSGRIVGLADVFDALVSRRCYKEPYPLKESVAIIRDQQGRQFDAVVSKAFLSVLDEVLTAYPTAKA